MMDDNEKVENALSIADWGSIDGDHHTMWVIDQMVRALTGCTSDTETQEYEDWVADFNNGEEGPNTYEWDTGIAP